MPRVCAICEHPKHIPSRRCIKCWGEWQMMIQALTYGLENKILKLPKSRSRFFEEAMKLREFAEASKILCNMKKKNTYNF